MNLTISILGLAFLILIHEAGHFFTALAVGMRPRSFNVGFGPPLVKVRRRGIEYAVRAIPLGGYVKIPGMHRPAAKDVDIAFARAIHADPGLLGPAERLKRALAAEDFEAAKIRLAEFEERAEAAGARGIDRGVREIGDGLTPEAYWRQRPWRRIAAILAGPVTNLVFAFVLFAIVFTAAIGHATTTVNRVLPGHPAAKAGLESGDRIIAIDGNIVSPGRVSTLISASKGRPIMLTVLRDNELIQLHPEAPRKVAAGIWRLGFELQAVPFSFGAGLWEAVKTTGVVTRETATSLGRIFHKRDRQQISGTVGITNDLKDAVSYGWGSYLLLLGFISLSLALLNLLPLLPLDGGHIAFSLLEGIRGRAIAREIYERVSAVGIAVVLLLFFVGLSNDVGRLGGG